MEASKEGDFVKAGLALAGGGVSGSAAIGVIQALEETGITISHIAGSSSGSIVAALYAYGYNADRLKQIMPQFTKRQLDFDWRAILSRALRRRRYLDGWIKGSRIQHLLSEMTDSSSVNAFRIPCGIVSTDLRTGQPVVFSNQVIPNFETETDISIAQALLASSAIPVIFQPVRWKGRVLSDGGVVMNCPVQIVREMGAERIIAIDTVTAFANEDVGQLHSGLSVFAHVINLNLRNQMAHELRLADISIHPRVGYVGAFDFHKVEQCVKAGYEKAWDMMDQIHEVLNCRD